MRRAAHAVGIQFAPAAVILVVGAPIPRGAAKETRLQRLFSTFPGGWPGVGLLLLRLAVGVTAFIAGLAALTQRGTPSLGAVIVSLIAIACGALLLIGFLTPGAALLTGLGSAGLTLPGCPALAASVPDARPTPGFVIVMAIAILLLGPGAFSLDSYLFGRREIVIPHESRASRQ